MEMTTAQFDADLVTAGLPGAYPGGTCVRAVYCGAPPPPQRTLWQILEATAEAFPRAAALDDGRRVLDYTGLLREVRRAGGRLASMGIGAGDRVGIRITSGTAELYLSVLAVLSVGAAYVPVDVDDPGGRAELVWSVAGVCAVLGDGSELTWREVQSAGRGARRPEPGDDAWIIFTSGTTGTPKGVAVTHRNAAAFVDAEAKLFLRGDPLGPGDRVLAGLSVAFDASCEEMWLAWRHGACLVPAPRPIVRTGPELVTWLAQRRVSVVSTVPTLAALWPAGPPPGVRLLVVGGEVCPGGLAGRLARPGTEVWNTYGPTEATVVSCAAWLSGGEPVRIGLPLDGWRLAVVDPANGQLVPWGEAGELVIGGVGVARYLDPERDAVDFRPLEALGWERAYHTGDLVRADREGLIYLGRADAQVKIRGYRIEPSEIEAVLMRLPGIGLAAVTTYEPHPGVVELAGYYTLRDRAAAPDRQAMYDYLRDHLPRHMVPAYLEELPAIPLLPDGKADRKHLPAPASSDRFQASRAYVAPATPGEKALADALAELLGLERVSADSQFFDHLGLSSLLVAHFCALARERAESPPLSVKDVYLHPTVRSLAAAVTEPPPVSGGAAIRPGPGEAPRPGTAQYVACGALQLLAFLASVLLASAVLAGGFSWISGSAGWADLYLRSLALSAGALLLLCSLPILAKWTLIGRWKPREIKVWSLPYLRFWLVKTLVQTDPLALFTGSPVYPLYLRALGAKIGRRVVIFSRTVPVCTDMLAIGDDTVIRRESSFTGYRAVAGVIHTGPVSIGREALIGEHTVLDIGTRVGDRSQLGHTSSLYESQAVPDGQRWHGSPAQRTDVDYRSVEPIPSGPLRRTAYGTMQVLSLIFVTMPLAIAAAVAVLTRLPAVVSFAVLGAGGLTMASFYQDGLILSTALFGGAILLGVAVVVAVPRVLRRFITPGRIYPLYGLRHWLHRVIRRLTNIGFYLELTGDSSYVVYYLRALGYRLPDFEQTGSNFGADLEHETPFLIDIGRGTMVADGATFIDAGYSSTSFRVTPLSIGPRNFLGNAVAYPAGGRTGENCLIATKAMVPLDGPVRASTGLLGSPCFEIPRSVTIDDRFDHLRTGEEFRRRLRAKNRHNLGTMGLFLAVRWVHVFVITLFAMAAWEFYHGNGVLALAGLIIASLLFSLAYFITVERALMRFGSLRPRYCSIYDPYFWWHERYWKLMVPPHVIGMFNGTPLKSPVWRLVGVRIGRRVFDDGCAIAERTLVTIGDRCTLNAGSVIQCHSMEDGIFKADYTVLEDGCTLGANALVHYGVTMGQGAQLQPDSFLMKGEKVPPHARWGGNPARAM
jgi:non-ribosomal peptide synthetase-like protein